MVLVGTCHVLGPLIAGTAVASTVAGLVRVSSGDTIAVVGAGLTGARPVLEPDHVVGARRSSSSHALVGGLVGASVVNAGWTSVRWGGLDGIRPVGVVGVLISLAVSPVVGFVVALERLPAMRRTLRRARRGMATVLRRGEWITAAALAFAHGANDAQKTMGVITVMLIADGRLSTFAVPLWVKLVAAASLTFGTLVGGWRIVRTLGRGIYRLRAQDGLGSQGASAMVILSAAAVGGPVSTTHVVASSVMGVGAGQHLRHVRWAVVREIVAGWLLTLPATCVAGMLSCLVWRRLT